ncbi:LCP family protein [Nesterenkonia sp. MY13]|uniref:LCP family protein n=1 Tax=Nesterenkonia sedimenti TaxID=1463632 RepID=A0A7X8TLU3_9MICC|nr:LCP family protein [Nesterenkonia sedimenti]NLS10936.1 LCP family protein [Nesterenkonia sedimenti]
MTEELFADQEAPEEAPKKRGKKITLIVLSSMLVLVLGGAAAAFWYLSSVRGAYEDAVNVLPEEHTFPDEDTEEYEAPDPVTRDDGEEDEQINILLIGSDSGGGSGETEDVPWLPNAGRADTIMWMHIPHERDSIQIMSIMRDTWVPIPGHGEAKINSSLSFGEGSSVAVATLENLVGVPIDHVATVDMVGFQNLVGELGGVTVNVPESFSSRDGYHYTAGPQHMSPMEAMSFVRERQSFSDGDFTRVRNQQAFMRGVLQEVLQPSTMTNPGQVHDMVSTFASNMAVDSGLADGGYVTDVAWSTRSVRGGDIDLFTLPNHGIGTAGSESIVVADFDAFAAAGEAMREGTFEEYAANN